MNEYVANVFAGRTAVLGTKHSKEVVIAPVLEKSLHISVMVPKDFDSDLFGTFTKERSRKGNQLEAARAKALAAMEVSGLDLGIASEGSFGPDPGMPFIQSNLELVLLVDLKHGLEIRGHHRSTNTNAASSPVTSVGEAMEFARTCGFPEHKLIVHSNSPLRSPIYKGIGTEKELRHRVEYMLSQPLIHKAYVETDMRAHCNPTRMENIQKATEDLVRNCLSVCLQCNTPGFVPKEVLRGASCRLCKRTTDRPRGEIYACSACTYTEERLLNEQTVDPGECPFCNP